VVADSGNTSRTVPLHDFAKILASAKSTQEYSYETPARGVVAAKNPDDIKHNGVTQGNAPTKLTIAKALRVSTPSPLVEEVLARIVSDRAYPELGILPGANYVWRYRKNPDPTTWQVYIIPDKPAPLEKLLTRGDSSFTDGDHTQPRIVRGEITKAALVGIVFGACLDDPACTSGHCGYY